MISSYTNMPFQKPNELFIDELYNKFIIKSIEWIKESSRGGAFASNYGSNWEAAYVLEYLIDVSKIIRERNDSEIDIQSINSMCDSLVDFLIKPNDDINITNWEGNTWDTSVIANALLYYIDYYGIRIADKTPICNKMQKVLPNIIFWLYKQFTENEASYSQYSFSVVDYSRIMFLFIYVCKSKYAEKLLRPVNLKVSNMADAIYDLAKHIDKLKTTEMIPVFSESTKTINSEEIINWGDSFVTAEICEALGRYLLFLDEHRELHSKERDQDDWILEIYSLLKKAVRWIENMQSSEGMWGAHDDTIRCMSSYISTIKFLKNFEKSFSDKIVKDLDEAPSWINESNSEEHKVFKAIRWLFDPKQRFSDGSYLHTSFLSVFFFESFISIYNLWDFAKGKTVYKLYDEVFWMSPARTTQDKGRVVELEIVMEKKLVTIRKLKQQRRVFTLACVTFMIIMVVLFVAIFIGLLSINISIAGKNVDALALVFTFVVFVFSTVGTRYFYGKGEQ